MLCSRRIVKSKPGWSPMTDRNRGRRSRRIAGAIRLAAMAPMLATAACAQVKETASAASAKIDQWFGFGADQAWSAEPDAGRLYPAEHLSQA